MIKELKYNIRHTFFYSLGNISVKLVGFILLPLYTTKLTTDQYGILAILETTLSILSPLFLLNIGNAIVRFFGDKKYQEYRGEILFNAFIFSVFTGILLNIAFQPFSSFFSEKFFHTRDFAIYFRFLFLNIALQNIAFVVRNYYNAKQLSFKFSMFNFLRFIIVLLLTIYFIVKLNWGIKGIMLAQTLSFIITILVFLPGFFSETKLSINFSLLKHMLAYSAPLAFSSISTMIFATGDRYIIKFLMNDAAVGIYSLAVKFATVIDFFILQNFQLSYLPYSFASYSKEEYPYRHSKMTTYLVFIMVISALFISLFALEVIEIFSPYNKNYWAAAAFVPFLAFLRPLYALRFMFGIAMHIRKKTSLIPIIVIVAAVLNIALNFLFIPILGINGAILASFISAVVMTLSYLFFSVRYFKVKYEYFRILVVYILAYLFAMAGRHIMGFSLIIGVVLKLGLFLLFIILLRVVGFFSNEEVQTVRSFLKKIFAKVKK